MAWSARIITKTRNPRRGNIHVTVGYFNDTNPERILVGRHFIFPLGTTRLDAIAEIRRVGQELKILFEQRLAERQAKEALAAAQLAQADTVYAQISVNSEVALP